MNKIEHKDGKVFIDGQEYAPVDKPKFPERPLGSFVIPVMGSGITHRDHYNDWQSKEFAELVSADQRRRNAMWQAVYMFDPESKGRGKYILDKREMEDEFDAWFYSLENYANRTEIGVNSLEAAQNCIDWLTEQGV